MQEAASDDAFASDFLGGQNPFEYFAPVAENIKIAPLSAYDQGCVELIQNAFSDYFQGNVPMEMPPVSFNSSSFRIRVWKLLMEIPYGHTVTYGEIARTLEKQTGRRICAQAVGGAVGHNPVSIIVPCHRVIGSNGLTGYAGGLDKKLALLRLEGVNVH